MNVSFFEGYQRIYNVEDNQKFEDGTFKLLQRSSRSILMIKFRQIILLSFLNGVYIYLFKLQQTILLSSSIIYIVSYETRAQKMKNNNMINYLLSIGFSAKKSPF